MSECYHCRGDGMDPDCDYLMECPFCGGNGENYLFSEDEEDYMDDQGEAEWLENQALADNA